MTINVTNPTQTVILEVSTVIGPKGDKGEAGSSPVQSVQGKIGAVELSPADIGAAPAIHTHNIATPTADGILSKTDKEKLDGIERNATENSSDAILKERANHTGVQAISTIAGLQTAIDSKYTKATTGIPRTDLDSSIQSSLMNADILLSDTIPALQTALAGKATQAQGEKADTAIQNIAGMHAAFVTGSSTAQATFQSSVSIDGSDGAAGPVQSVLSRPVSEYDSASTTSIGKMTHSFAKRFQFRPIGVSIIYSHAGGGGAATNVSAVVACSDDLGTGQYGTAESDWYFMVPYRGGVRKNTLSDDGWQNVTWKGEVTTGCANDVFQRTRFVESDYIPLNPVEDVRYPGWYGILCRIYTGDGARSRGGYSNMLSPTYSASRGPAAEYCANRASNGPDFIEHPEYWDDTIARVAQDWELAPIALRVYGQAGAVQTVLLSGDSRFHISTETANTAQYANFGFYLENAAREAGRQIYRACAGGSGIMSQHYTENTSRLQTIARPDILAHIVYSANDGVPQSSVIEFCKARALKVASVAKRSGGRVLLVTSYPNVGGFSGPQMELLQELDRWAATVSGVMVFSPLAVYGNSTGDYLAGMGSAGPHMSQAAYRDMATKILMMI